MKIVVTKFYQVLLLSICLVEISVSNNCKKLAQIPCEHLFKDSEFSAPWANLYTAYLAKNASTDQESPEWKDLKRGAFISNPFCQTSSVL